jgi:hypothetical protein
VSKYEATLGSACFAEVLVTPGYKGKVAMRAAIAIKLPFRK